MARRGSGGRRLLIAGAVVVVLGVGGYALVVFGSGQIPEWTTTAHLCTQPDSVSYQQGSSYSVYVRDPSFSLSLNPGPADAVVSRTGDGSYGVSVELNPSTDPYDIRCRWRSDRVDITEPDGITHTVPASAFTAGR